MLLEFSITNFRSIKDRQTFSMLTSSRVKERHNAPFVLENYDNTEVLKTAVLYGKNNAGKSNVLKAFGALRDLVTESDSFKVGESIRKYIPFAFDKQTLNQHTIFEIDFIGDNQIQYYYAVEFSRKEIIREKLSYYQQNAERFKATEVFSREKSILSYRKDLKEGEKSTLESIKQSMRDNQLILSLTATKKINEHFENAYLFFSQKIQVFSFDSDFEEKVFAKYALKLLKDNEDYLEKINDLIKVMDTGLLKIEIQEINPENFVFPDTISEEIKSKIIEDLKLNIEAQHRFFDGDKEIGTKNTPLRIESDGTRKLFSLLPIMINAFENGHLLMIDELDKSLNPYWTKFLIKMFYDSNQFNKNNSQLIFATHDTAQFRDSLFAKDQIYIIDKDYFGKTEITRFSDFTGIRKDIPFEKWYLSGRLGGVPVIDADYIQFEIEKKNGQKED
jgi:AAA15 family ATPase/GTPase